MVILQDRTTAHTAALVKNFCSSHSPDPIRMIVLPPDSPDLTPHDSGFLALVKRQWHRQTYGVG